jgi:hypothetical protein
MPGFTLAVWFGSLLLRTYAVALRARVTVRSDLT